MNQKITKIKSFLDEGRCVELTLIFMFGLLPTVMGILYFLVG